MRGAAHDLALVALGLALAELGIRTVGAELVLDVSLVGLLVALLMVRRYL